MSGEVAWRLIHIYFNAADKDDSAFASQIAQKLAGEGKCRLVPFTEFALAARNKLTLLRSFVGGTTIVVLSSSALADTSVQRDVLPTLFWVQPEDTIAYYFLRGISVTDAKRYPGFEAILDRAMVSDASELDAIAKEFPDTVRRIAAQPLTQRNVRGFLNAVSVIVALPLIVVNHVRLVVNRTGLEIAILLGLWIGVALRQYWRLTPAMIAWSGFAVAFWLASIKAFEFWRWAPVHWRISPGGMRQAFKETSVLFLLLPPILPIIGALVAHEWGPLAGSPWAAVVPFWAIFSVQLLFDRPDSGVLSGRPTLGTDEARASLTRAAVSSWRASFVGEGLGMFLMAVLLFWPAFYWSRHGHEIALRLWLLGAGCGLILVALLNWALSVMRENFGKNFYLTGRLRSTLAEAGRRPRRPPWAAIAERNETRLSLFADSERTQVGAWLDSLRTKKKDGRRWSVAPKKAFISYAWKDEEELGVVDAIRSGCVSVGTDCYLDQTQALARHGIWRPSVGQALAKSSHLFLLVGPHIVEGRTVWHEIDLAMMRWFSEDMPAVICVADDGVVDRLVADPMIPLPLRFLLVFCPRISYEEARQPEVLRKVIGYTHSRGVWEHWRMILLPMTRMFRLLRPEYTL